MGDPGQPLTRQGPRSGLGLLRRWAAPLLAALAALLGAKLGYDAGVQIAGVWLGIIMAANAGLFGALLVGAVMDKLQLREDSPPRRQPPA